MAQKLRKYYLDTEENREYLRELGDELLAFGQRFPSPGGSSWYLGDDGTPWKDRPRETWITSRMTHVYSIGTMLAADAGAAKTGSAAEPGAAKTGSAADAGEKERFAALADAGLKGLRGELRDKENGGWYAGLAPDGTPLPTKQCYAHAFVILAACSAYLAGRPGAEELLKDALADFDRYFWDEKESLTRDTWDTEFRNCDDYRGLNANMHTVEAFLAVADTLKDEKYRVRAGKIITRVLGWAAANGWRIPEHFSKDWQPDLNCNADKKDDQFKPYGATPGHGIEWSRLITQWAFSTFRKEGETGIPEKAAPFLRGAEQLFRRAIGDAWNADGAPGIVYTTDWEGTAVVHDRMHWTLAEAINAAAVLFRVTGDHYYSIMYAEFMAYLDQCVHDPVNGSWFHQMDRENRPIGTVWPGKSDLYHAFQATKIPYLDPAVSIAAAVHAAEKQD